jgi:hypothetical protein
MIQDAIRGYVASLRKHGDPLRAGHEVGEFEVVELEVERAG